MPLLMVAVACALAYAALHVQLPVDSEVWFLFSGSGKQAPEFLSSLMTAMINMATLAISITMVVLALSAQQLGPRLIRSFMGDRKTQFSIGILIATVVYLLLVLRSAYGFNKSVSNLGVTGGTLLVLISVITLLLFLHHLAKSIVADSVIDRVGAQLDAEIERQCPTDPAPAVALRMPADAAPIGSGRSGYVKAIEYEDILKAAIEYNATVEIKLRAGDHVVGGVVAALVAPPPVLSEPFERAIRDAIVIGPERTIIQDLEFPVRHLVEIAVRALSPGINDVYTALAVIDRLAVSLHTMMQRQPPKSVWTDTAGRARVIAKTSTFDGVVDAAFNQIRQNSAGKPAILIRLVDSIGQLLQQANAAQRIPLERHLRLVLDAGRREIAAADDVRDLEQRAEIALAATE